MDPHLTLTTDPGAAYGVTLIAEAPAAAPKLSDAERLNVAQWLREAQSQLRDVDAGVPTHCSQVIVNLCRLVQQLTGEGFLG